MTRHEAIERAAELKVILIKLHTPEGNMNLVTWKCHFAGYPMRSRKHPEHGLLGFIESAEQKINHYREVLARWEAWKCPTGH